MELQAGDWVQTETGLRGRILHLSRLSAFVEVQVELQGGVEVLPFLISELKKIDPPSPPSTKPPVQ